MSRDAKHFQLAIPKYARLVKNSAGRDELAVNIPDAVAIMKLKTLLPQCHTPNLILNFSACNDAEASIIRILKTVFHPNRAAMATMAHELAAASFNLDETINYRSRDKVVHFSTVTLNERRETCKAMMPRLMSITAHSRAMKMEYKQMFTDFKLDRLVFDAELLSYNEFDEEFDGESLVPEMQDYMKNLGGKYEVAELDASPQPVKKTKTEEGAAATATAPVSVTEQK